jgi:hypothetical protein
MTLPTFAVAQAIGICWLHHFRGSNRVTLWDGLHPRGKCEWCEWPQVEKIRALEEYNASPIGKRQREAFFHLAGPVRLRLIREAQQEEAA